MHAWKREREKERETCLLLDYDRRCDKPDTARTVSRDLEGMYVIHLAGGRTPYVADTTIAAMIRKPGWPGEEATKLYCALFLGSCARTIERSGALSLPIVILFPQIGARWYKVTWNRRSNSHEFERYLSCEFSVWFQEKTKFAILIDFSGVRSAGELRTCLLVCVDIHIMISR